MEQTPTPPSAFDDEPVLSRGHSECVVCGCTKRWLEDDGSHGCADCGQRYWEA